MSNLKDLLDTIQSRHEEAERSEIYNYFKPNGVLQLFHEKVGHLSAENFFVTPPHMIPQPSGTIYQYLLYSTSFPASAESGMKCFRGPEIPKAKQELSPETSWQGPFQPTISHHCEKKSCEGK